MTGFIFGAPGLPATPQELSDKRKAAQAMIARALGRAPKNVGEGLNAIGQALIARSMEDEARKSQQAGLASGQAATAALMGGMTAPDTVSGGTGGAATAPAPSPASPAPATPASFSGGSQEFVAQMMPHAQRVAQQTGVDPRIVIAQAALESGWGRRAPGNNFFGIKSHGVPGGNTFATTEVVNGQPIRTRDSFRAYGSMGESADGYAQFLRQNPRYRPMLQAQGLDAQIQALGASGYATDPNYAAKIRQIASGIQVPQAAPVAAPVAQPPDSLDGGDGSDPAPLIDGRNLPDSGALPVPDLAGTFDTMRMAAPGPMDPRARSFDQIAQAGMQPSQAMSPAPSVDSMMAGQQITPPMQAQPAPPVSAAPMPAAPAVAAPMQAPMPMARPNIEPPPQAQPAMAQTPMGGMNERDRLMLLRDEQSLAPGEAQNLRAGLGGGNPVEMIAQALGRPQTPAAAPQSPAQPAPAQPAPVASVAAAMGAPAPQAAPAQAAASPQSRVAAALQVLNNPWAPPGTQAMAQSILQQSLTPQQMQIVSRPDGTVLGINPRSGETRTLATGTNAPPKLEPIKDAAGNVIGTFNPTTGETRPVGGAAAVPRIEGVRTVTDPAERARLGIPQGDTRPYQLKPDGTLLAVGGAAQGGLSESDKAARRAAEDAVAQAQSGLRTINRAIELNSTAYTGWTAGARANVLGQMGVQSAQDTQIFRNSAMSGVLSSLKSIFGGNPTEGERKILLEVEGAVDAPERVRGEILSRAKQAAEERIALNQRRIAELGGSASQTGVRSVQTPAEAQALPPGTRYRTPDGREYVR
jgi:flagellar rod assembly protein/muramidase FlgJ